MALVGVAHSVGILDVHYTVPLSLHFEEWFPIRPLTEGEGVTTNINGNFLTKYQLSLCASSLHKTATMMRL